MCLELLHSAAMRESSRHAYSHSEFRGLDVTRVVALVTMLLDDANVTMLLDDASLVMAAIQTAHAVAL